LSPVSINAVMVRLVDHAGHQLWNAEKPEMAPKTEADWENIVEHATQIAAAGALIRLEGTGPNDRTFVQNPEWQKFAMEVSAAGMAALKAGEAKNHEALVAANGQLVEACEGCHKRFKPALPSEGITHSHLH
jgi:cytochrome c556